MKKFLMLTAVSLLLASCGQNLAQPQQQVLSEAVPTIVARPQTSGAVKPSSSATEVYAADQVEMDSRWDEGGN